jgi:Zn-finger nucleic acid-binding protein
MRCPIDRSDLTVVERYGVDVHLCPTCQHVWLSDSDLDTLVAQAIAGSVDDDLDVDSDRRSRRRDKYSDDFDLVERPRKGRSRRAGREMVEDFADY